ncbi:unnamed protein product [Kluyveromyces dobzhanskii CBS 2104]|uniref:WGS project CCBQ000000000 data, contig 00102 n=1 Tax=Kluyveromyces dobzhanskii CBS 2104 TaxID=1427455 RepID=A0A0A8L6L4_9SACH|nr:unnamed protein product [Kluyveromyces dobzhanskii CBS 2104]
MSFLFYGDPQNLRSRETHQFKTIEKSEHYKQLQSLPVIPSSSLLRQDHIFSNVSKEVSQISADVAVVYSKLQDEIDTEESQTKEINDKVSHSVKKLESSFAKLMKLRSKFDKNSDKQRRQFESKFSDVQKKIRMIRDSNDELLEYITKKGPQKIDQERFSRIAKLLEVKFPQIYGNDDDATKSGSDDESSHGLLIEDPMETIESSYESVDGSRNGSNGSENDVGGNSAGSNDTKSYRHSILSAPLVLSSMRVASQPSIATTLEHICITEPFSRPRDVNEAESP